MKESFIDRNFKPESLAKIDAANTIIEEYQADGFTLTLRQLYYQFVSRDLIANTHRNYKNLGSLINDGRLAGLIDWSAIEDRTRNLKSNSHWSTGSGILRSAAYSFALDKWANQDYHVEVWIEKDALVGVIETVCDQLDVPYFACRGYTSQSELYTAGKRMRDAVRCGQQCVIIHLGDHDPSGMDMTRDNSDRVNLFAGRHGVEVQRVALNWDQIEEYSPPPNYAKESDSRHAKYVEQYGDESWELDALEPRVISDLIEDTVIGYRDPEAWEEMVSRENNIKNILNETARDMERDGL